MSASHDRSANSSTDSCQHSTQTIQRSQPLSPVAMAMRQQSLAHRASSIDEQQQQTVHHNFNANSSVIVSPYNLSLPIKYASFSDQLNQQQLLFLHHQHRQQQQQLNQQQHVVVLKSERRASSEDMQSSRPPSPWRQSGDGDRESLASVEVIVRDGLRAAGEERRLLMADVRRDTCIAQMTYNLHTRHNVAAGQREYLRRNQTSSVVEPKSDPDPSQDAENAWLDFLRKMEPAIQRAVEFCKALPG